MQYPAHREGKARKQKELAKKLFKPRMIVHPRFQNITAEEAVKFLSDKDLGESVIRPSSCGPQRWTLTLKVFDGVYAHKDIEESGKEDKDITALLRIGKTLKIKDGTFEDLDEVMDRYVDLLVAHLKAMLNYRKFRRGNKTEIDEHLRIEKAENPMRIVYCFGIFHEHPGTFILTYIRSSNPRHEYISLYPKGLKFRKRIFEDIDHLVAYFQRHIDDPHDSSPSIRSVAAMVPMSPAAGGSSAFGGDWGGSSNDGDWRGGPSTERDRGSGSRTERGDYRNGDGHSSGAPRPYSGRGRGHGQGSCGAGRGDGGERHDSDRGSQRWGSKDGGSYGTGRGDRGERHDSDQGSQRWGSKDGNNGRFGNFPGAKVQNSPGREAFPGSWGGDGRGATDGGSSSWSNWGQGSSSANAGTYAGASGWGSSKKTKQTDDGGWDGGGG